MGADKRRPALAAKASLPARRRFICLHKLLAGCPTELIGVDDAPRRERSAVGLPANRTVAITHELERAGDLVSHRSAQTAASHSHGLLRGILGRALLRSARSLGPPSHAQHVRRKLGTELCKQGALLGLDLVFVHVCHESRQEQGSVVRSLRKTITPANATAPPSRTSSTAIAELP